MAVVFLRLVFYCRMYLWACNADCNKTLILVQQFLLLKSKIIDTNHYSEDNIANKCRTSNAPVVLSLHWHFAYFNTSTILIFYAIGAVHFTPWWTKESNLISRVLGAWIHISKVQRDVLWWKNITPIESRSCCCCSFIARLKQLTGRRHRRDYRLL